MCIPPIMNIKQGSLFRNEQELFQVTYYV